MLQRVITVGQELAAESLTFDEAGNTAWAATTSGALVTVRLLDQRVTLIGSGYRRPIGVIPGHDGLTVAVVERNGRTWLALRDQASRLRAQFVIDLPGRVLAARRHPEPGRLLVLSAVGAPAGSPEATIFSVDLRDGTANIVADGLADARTFVVDEARRELVVLIVTEAGERSLTAIGLDDGAVTPGRGRLAGVRHDPHLAGSGGARRGRRLRGRHVAGAVDAPPSRRHGRDDARSRAAGAQPDAMGLARARGLRRGPRRGGVGPRRGRRFPSTPHSARCT